MRNRPASRRLLALVALPCIALGGAACLGYPADGMVGTPPQPTTAGQSRLPQLLSQLQGQSGAGLELFDGSQNQVLAAQDQQGKDSGEAASPTSTAIGTVTPSATVAGTRTAGNSPTPRGEGLNSTPTPGPGTPTATPSASATPAPSQTATATATPTLTPTPSPAGPPSEGDVAATTPPTE